MSALVFLAFFLLSATTASASQKDHENCVYTMYVKTGSVIKGGTDSKISVALGDKWGSEVKVIDLEGWGLMGPNYEYYERGNMDVFSGLGSCLSGPLCRLNLTSDGSGDHHGWYCDYIEVTATGPHQSCTQTVFYVRQWLATDAPPYELSALLDGCSQMQTEAGHDSRGPFVVGNPLELDASN